MRGMPDRLQYFAIRYTSAGFWQRALVALHENVVYWGGSPSHCNRSGLEDFEIIKDYGWDDEWPEDFDLDVQYAKDFPPKPCDIETFEKKDTEGLLSPEGIFYDCPYGGHSLLCLDLLRIMDIDEGISSEDTLLKQGWLCLRYVMIGSDYENPPTEAQVKWLKRAAELNDEAYQCKVANYLEHWEFMKGIKAMPTLKVPNRS